MMSYTVCSLGIGDRYLNNILATFKKINTITQVPSFLVVADNNAPEFTENKIHKINAKDLPFRTKDDKWFNYNLKFLAIKEAIKLNTEFIVYIDSDWSALDGYNDEKFKSLFDCMNTYDIDFVYERPHPIGGGKHDGRECFWWHKIEPYGLDKTDFYDEGQVCNEQCFVIKNNSKITKFIECWERLYWKSYEESIWPFAEGVEIGMSTIEAGMNFKWEPLLLLRGCFSFYSRDGGYNSRY